MDHDQKLISLLEDIQKSNRKQTALTRLQLILSTISIVCCLIVLFSVLKVFPKIQTIITEAGTVVVNMEDLTEELAKAEFTGVVSNIDALVGDVDELIGNVDKLVSTSQSGVEETMTKINAVDFDALNQAIQDLSDVIEPLAKITKKLPFG